LELFAEQQSLPMRVKVKGSFHLGGVMN